MGINTTVNQIQMDLSEIWGLRKHIDIDGLQETKQ